MSVFHASTVIDNEFCHNIVKVVYRLVNPQLLSIGKIHDQYNALSETRLLPELRWVLSCESPAIFLHFPPEEKRPWGPFYQLQRVLAKGRRLLQILLKALSITGQTYEKLTSICKVLSVGQQIPLTKVSTDQCHMTT